MKNIILDSGDIKNKINRISFEIIEKNFDKDEIIMVGLLPNGKYLSKEISECIKVNSEIIMSTIHFNFDKKKRKISCEESDFDFNDLKK